MKTDILKEYAAEVEAETGVPSVFLTGDRRLKDVVRARRMLWKKLRDRGWSNRQIAMRCHRDPTVIGYGIRRLEAGE